MNSPINSLSIGGFVGLTFVGIVAVAYVVFVIVKITEKTTRPMMLDRSRIAFLLSAIGLPAFLIGFALIMLGEPGRTNLGFKFVVSGFLVLCVSILLNALTARSKRASWPVIPARCVAKQLEQHSFASDDGSRDGWRWRISCEIKYGGKPYVIIPKVNWCDFGQVETPFWSEEKGLNYISKRISPKGECKVRINPDDPLEAELL